MAVRYALVLVDDNAADVRLLDEAFSESGYDVDVRGFENAERCLQYLEVKETAANIPPPDALLLDVHLPNHGAERIVEFLRCCTALARVPRFLYTGDERCGNEPLLGHAPDQCIRKPPDWNGLLAVADRLWEVMRASRVAGGHPARSDRRDELERQLAHAVAVGDRRLALIALTSLGEMAVDAQRAESIAAARETILRAWFDEGGGKA